MTVQRTEQCRPSPREAGSRTVLATSLWRERERIKRAGGRAEMALGQMQVDGRYFEIAMTHQYLDRAQVSAGFKQVRGEAMSQSVRMNAPVVEAGAFGGDLAGTP